MGNKESSPLRECKIGSVTYFLPKNFTNETKCGEGGQATVLEAIDENTKQRVAIKRISLISSRTRAISTEHAKNAYREVMLLGLVKHPNIISLLHAYTPDPIIDTFKELYLVMPFTTNTLQARIHCLNKRFKNAETLKIIYGILNGLDYLHKLGIVHRDLKPSNIGINKNGDPIIFDFGLARLDTVNSITNGVGTWVYMAPEIFTNLKCPGHVAKADIWSLGCIWIEMINRERFVTGIRSFDRYWPKLLELLGTPDDDFMNKVPESSRLYFKSLKVYEAKPWDKLIPTDNFCKFFRNSEKHINKIRFIISRMLKYDPEKRWSVQQLISQFERNNWCKRNTVACDPIKIEEFKRICHKAKEDEKLWKELLFKRMKHCTTLLKSPVHEACYYNNVDELLRLLNENASLNAKDSDGRTPLHIAVQTNNIEIARLLLEKEARVNATDEYSKTPLHIAVWNNSVECVRLLLEKEARVNAKDSGGLTPLHIAVQKDNIEIIRLLKEKEARVNATDEYSKTPLHIANWKDRVERARLLREKEAYMDKKDFNDAMLLHIALQTNNIQIIRLPKEKGADVHGTNKYEISPLQIAAWNNRVERLLSEKGAYVDKKDSYGMTPINFAEEYNAKIINKKVQLI